jgi:PAS domain S-box-containing protein
VEQLKAMQISDINTLPPEEIAEKVQSAAAREENVFNFSHRLSSGEIRQVEVYSTPLRMGRQELLLSIVHDVSERVRLEAT